LTSLQRAGRDRCREKEKRRNGEGGREGILRKIASQATERDRSSFMQLPPPPLQCCSTRQSQRVIVSYEHWRLCTAARLRITAAVGRPESVLSSQDVRLAVGRSPGTAGPPSVGGRRLAEACTSAAATPSRRLTVIYALRLATNERTEQRMKEQTNER